MLKKCIMLNNPTDPDNLIYLGIKRPTGRIPRAFVESTRAIRFFPTLHLRSGLVPNAANFSNCAIEKSVPCADLTGVHNPRVLSRRGALGLNRGRRPVPPRSTCSPTFVFLPRLTACSHNWGGKRKVRINEGDKDAYS